MAGITMKQINVLAVGFTDEQAKQFKAINHVPHPKFEFTFKRTIAHDIDFNLHLNKCDLVIFSVNSLAKIFKSTPRIVDTYNKGKVIILSRDSEYDGEEEVNCDDSIAMLYRLTGVSTSNSIPRIIDKLKSF